MKNFKNVLTVLVALILFLGVSSKGYAVILDFEDITTANRANFFHKYGLDWYNFEAVKNTVNSPGLNYEKGAVLPWPGYMASNTLSNPETWIVHENGNLGETFSFQGAYFYYPMFKINDPFLKLDSLLTIDGFKIGDAPGSPTYSTTISLNNQNGVSVYNLGFNDVTSLRFISESDNNTYPYFAYFTMDNADMTPIPEPSSMVLGAMGLLGLLKARRRNKV